MLTEFTFNILRQIAHGTAVQFGSDCEVVIHDLSLDSIENSIVFIENGHITARKKGDGPSRIVLDTLKAGDVRHLQDKLAYLTRTHDGKILKSSTMFIRDENGQISAIFAINFDITNLVVLDGSLRSLTSTGDDEIGASREPEEIPININDLLDELIAQSIKLVGKPVALMTKDDKIRAIQFLDQSGAFLITKSGDKISKQFGISKYTMYSYIDAGKN